MFDKVECTIEWLTPYVQHNGQLADRACRYVVEMKKLTSKPAKQKTDSDFKLLDDLEWEGGLYLDHEMRVIVPGNLIEGAYYEAGKKQRLGPTVRAAIVCPGDFRLSYPGPTDLAKLKADPRFRYRCIVRNPSTKGRVARMRPRFPTCGLTYTIQYRPDMLDRGTIIHLTEILGTDIGLSDDRTKMGGRFKLVKVDGKADWRAKDKDAA